MDYRIPNPNHVAYLAGPMTGIEGFNQPAFAEAAKRLRAQGFTIWNPAELVGGSMILRRSWYMRAAFAALPLCEFVFLMDGWQESEGVAAELAVALGLGLRIYEIIDIETPALRPLKIENFDASFEEA